MIIGIVAVAENLAIGKDGKLPWHYSADLKFFKETTKGNVVVMGRKTFDSIGKPLPNRLNIILSRSADADKNTENLLFFAGKKSILEFIKNIKTDVFIIGGASIYAEFSDVIEKWYVTEIPLTVDDDADAFMPRSFLEDFSLVERKELQPGLLVKVLERKQ